MYTYIITIVMHEHCAVHRIGISFVNCTIPNLTVVGRTWQSGCLRPTRVFVKGRGKNVPPDLPKIPRMLTHNITSQHPPPAYPPRDRYIIA